MFHNEVTQSDVNCITIRIKDLHLVARKKFLLVDDLTTPENLS